MSVMYCIASDAILPQIKNPYLKTMSVNEALTMGIEVPEDLLRPGYDRDKQDVILWVDWEHHRQGVDDDFSIWPFEKTADIPTKKQFCAGLDREPYTQGFAHQLIAYLKAQLAHVDEVELWCLWLGNTPPIRVIKTEIPIDKLTAKDIEAFMALDTKVGGTPSTCYCYLISANR